MPGLVGSRLQTEHFYTSCKLHSMFYCEKPSGCDRHCRAIRETPEVSAFSHQVFFLLDFFCFYYLF
ncbi:hypothetical protein ASZ78_015847 [Callipepla squamata]|uniref:Uncharacterized protein n=1 Tax=Callipepla squamata TaxID=9009 RepID=A0A226NHR0_CALSU|nr:hypothetical protein ASZ78_015847 [Callipepla squamata]